MPLAGSYGAWLTATGCWSEELPASGAFLQALSLAKASLLLPSFLCSRPFSARLRAAPSLSTPGESQLSGVPCPVLGSSELSFSTTQHHCGLLPASALSLLQRLQTDILLPILGLKKKKSTTLKTQISHTNAEFYLLEKQTICLHRV